jgi:hypothetical protein
MGLCEDGSSGAAAFCCDTEVNQRVEDGKTEGGGKLDPLSYFIAVLDPCTRVQCSTPELHL